MGIKNTKIKKMKLPEGVTKESIQTPEGLDDLLKVVLKQMKQDGLLPEDAELVSAKVIKNGEKETMVDFSTQQGSGSGAEQQQPPSIKELLSLLDKSEVADGAWEAIAKEPKLLDSVPEPDDPAKAMFVSAYNKFHKQCHFLALPAKEMQAALEVLKAEVEATKDSKLEEEFNAFHESVGTCMGMMTKAIAVVCLIGAGLKQGGVPGPEQPKGMAN